MGFKTTKSSIEAGLRISDNFLSAQELGCFSPASITGSKSVIQLTLTSQGTHIVSLIKLKIVHAIKVVRFSLRYFEM